MYYQVTATVFSIIGLLHILRVVKGWDAVVGGVALPLWISYVAIAICAYLAYRGFTAK